MSELVLIVGPIASGKSTVAQALGVRLRHAGRNVAVLDLDDVVETIGGFVGLTSDNFQRCQTVFGGLVGTWLANGFDVIAHGPFLERREDETLLRSVPDGIVPRRVLLRATYEVAVARVAGDPDRNLSKDPELLRLAYDRAASLIPDLPPSEWTFDTTVTSWQQVVAELSRALLDVSG